MNTTHILTLEQMESFVSGSLDIEFYCINRKEAYVYIERVLTTHRYSKLKKPVKGMVRSYLSQVTGFKSAQLTRLIRRNKNSGHITLVQRTQPTFSGKYLPEGILELARIDELHEGLSGPALVKILKREYTIFGNEACMRLKDLSSSHLYNLRKTNSYQRQYIHFTKTKSASVPIGERTKPQNNGQPGYLRVDSVHQGDKDGEKGVYHVNLVDEVTQWEVVVCIQGLSETPPVEPVA